MKLKIVINILLLILAELSFSQSVVINEIVASNNNLIQDDFGDQSDWIELYNSTEDSISLFSWYLSDNANNPLKWAFPDTTLEAHSFILIFCSGRDTLSGFLHSNFKLKASGETVFLSDSSGNLVDVYLQITLYNNVSFGRVTDGGSEFAYFYKTSPGSSNSNNIRLNNILFSSAEGFYSDNIELSMHAQDTLGQIFYTINGNEPRPGTPYTYEYIEPLSLIEIQSLHPVYSYIQTSPTDIPGFFQWQAPLSEVAKCVVLRAGVFENNEPMCNTLSGTYFIGNSFFKRFSFPVLSLIMDSIDFFSSDTGIYVPGKRYIPGEIKSGNYFERGEAWERKGSFTYFSPGGEVWYKQNLGIEIQGNITRAYPNKSLEFTVKTCYDGNDKFNYPFFNAYSFTDYKKVIVRSVFAAHDYSIVRDEIMQEISRNLMIDYQEWQPVNTFINGEYWGFQVMREKQDRHYLQQHYGINPDSVDIISLWGVPETGDLTDHDNLIFFVEYHDLSLPENYNVIKSWVDIPSYIDYYITEIFVANRDWPGNNYTKWKEKSPGSKWRWFLYDLDNGGVDVQLNNIKRAAGDTIDEITPEWSTLMFKSLLSNEEFKSAFIDRFVEVLNNDFHADNTIPIVNKWEAVVGSEVAQIIDRWQVIDSEELWHEKMENLRQFFLLRPCILKQQLEEYFEIDSLNISCGPSLVFQLPYSGIKIFPNPASDRINIESPRQILSWELFNLSGMMVKKGSNHNSLNAAIDIADLTAGIYFLSVNSGDAQHRFKVIKTN
jgi:hypothetical protein